jgi:hypothetical protein
MFGHAKNNELERKVKKHSIPEETRNHFLIVFLTFIMFALPPFIAAIISHFTTVHKSFDNMAYLWISIVYWLATVLAYPRDEVFILM